MTSRTLGKLLPSLLLPVALGFVACADTKEPSATALPTGANMRPVVRDIAPPPSPVFDVRDYGAKGDGVTRDTAAIQRAIDACAGTGGSVLLGKGRFVSGPLALRSDMTFYVAKDAKLLGSEVVKDYPRIYPPNPEAGPFESSVMRGLLYAWDVKNLTLDGGGEINLRGPRLFDRGMRDNERANILRVCRGKNITVRNLDLVDSLMWTQIYDRCENVVIEKLRVVDSPVCGTLDALDICNCRHVVVRDCYIDVADDAICLKSHGTAGIEDVLIENNTIMSLRNGIKLGTATIGPVKNLRIYDNTVLRAKQTGLSILSADGADVTGVDVRGLTITRTQTPIFIRLSAREEFLEMPNRRLENPGSIDAVHLENILVYATQNTAGSSISGIARRNIGAVTLKDIYVEASGGTKKAPPMPPETDDGYPAPHRLGKLPATGFFVRYADKVTFDNVRVGLLSPDARPWLVFDKADVKTTACGQIDAKPLPLPEKSARILAGTVNTRDFDEGAHLPPFGEYKPAP